MRACMRIYVKVCAYVCERVCVTAYLCTCVYIWICVSRTRVCVCAGHFPCLAVIILRWCLIRMHINFFFHRSGRLYNVVCVIRVQSAPRRCVLEISRCAHLLQKRTKERRCIDLNPTTVYSYRHLYIQSRGMGSRHTCGRDWKHTFVYRRSSCAVRCVVFGPSETCIEKHAETKHALLGCLVFGPVVKETSVSFDKLRRSS